MDYFDIIEYYFFINGYDYNQLLDISIFLNMSLKMEYFFMEYLGVSDFLSWFIKAQEIEKQRDAEREALKNKNK